MSIDQKLKRLELKYRRVCDIHNKVQTVDKKLRCLDYMEKLLDKIEYLHELKNNGKKENSQKSKTNRTEQEVK